MTTPTGVVGDGVVAPIVGVVAPIVGVVEPGLRVEGLRRIGDWLHAAKGK